MTDRRPSLKELRALYREGVNITAHLRERYGEQRNTADIIELAYDLQAGAYAAAMASPRHAASKDRLAREIADCIAAHCTPHTLLEAGVGEATTLAGVLRHLDRPMRAAGFDLSWSRLAYARAWLGTCGFDATLLCSADLQRIPFADNAFDVVCTAHAVEPNGGREVVILRELYRVARRLLVLVEPDAALADDAGAARMTKHGYCSGLDGHARALGYRVLEHRPCAVQLNPANPVALTVIGKQDGAGGAEPVFVCPLSGGPLLDLAGALFSPEAMVVYPVIGGIACLREQHAVAASAYEDWADGRLRVPT